MAGHYAAEDAFIDVFLRLNLPDWAHQKQPNRRFERPAFGGSEAPAKWFTYDTDYEAPSLLNAGRTRKVEGFIEIVAGVQADTGKGEITSLIDRLEDLIDSATTGIFAWGAVWPATRFEGEEKGGEDLRGWYGRQIIVPFTRLSSITSEDYIMLAGAGATSTQVATETPHGLQVGDWVGLEGSTWRRVRAVSGEPRCEGVVSLVNSDTNFVLTAIGAVRIPGHGWDVGPLYLSQASLGAGWQPVQGPESGVSRQVATVFDADSIIVLSLPEVEL